MYKNKKTNQYQYSPSDLTRYMESPFASWMTRFVCEFPDRAPEKDSEDALLQSLQQKGYAHEDKLEAKLIAEGKNVVKIEGDSNREKCEKTLAAMQSGADVVVQARLELGQLGGYADFLVKIPHELGQPRSAFGDWHYEVWDTKLAGQIKPTFIVQLCCYAEMLKAIQGILPENITVALGSGECETLQTIDFYHYYQLLKNNFLIEQQQFDPNTPPDPADSKHWGNWSDHAKALLLAKDHLFQIAGITQGQIKKLNQAGIVSVQQLVDSPLPHVKGVNPVIFSRLQAQASMQKQSADSDIPRYRVLPHKTGKKQGLALLPPHSPNDVFFDIEGFSLDSGGLEYLWGNTYFDADGSRQFKDFWAHNREEEKQAFQDFIHWIYARWQADPTMHIYHYASYEITACRKLMGRFGVCEHEVDQLLRNEVFVDLYKVVKSGMLLGTPNYSIKSVELLYRGKRDTEVGNGGDSMVVYDAWREKYRNGEEGYTWQTSEILKNIRDYNIDDCDSTQELVDWLRKQQAKNDIAYLGKTEVVDEEIPEEITEVIALRDRLLQRADSERKTDEQQAKLTENLAWVLEFHRREAKPVFWRLFDRLGLTEDELIDDLDCLALCQRTDREPFKPTPRARSLAYEYRFDTAQEFKGGKGNFYLLGEETEDGRNQSVDVVAEESDLDNGLIVLKSSVPLPPVVTLIPNEFVRPRPIPEAIFAVVSDYEKGTLGNLGKSAIIDFLTRAKPRITGHHGGNIVSSHDASTLLQEIIEAVKNLDHSYLPIQGPPGAGKSYTGKHIIAELMRQGAKVGIASNSHKAINNLLLSTAEYCRAENIPASFACTKDTESALTDNAVTITENSKLINHLTPSSVIGTTAWGFAREDLAEQLDYLFIDEAGQVAVANLVAMSRSAKNLVLMGDQMQLGQPSQGTHPAESGLSVLDYLLHETPTISADMGVFLHTTYRMHSRVNAFISSNIYAGKLQSHPSTDHRVIDVPNNYQGKLDQNAGLQFIPVEHEGNTQASDEEVEVIQSLVNELLGRTLHTENGETREVTLDDMLFVAPYNHQVSKLKAVLGEQAKVGSVDKFQGQEAPIVFLSLCASDAGESPRGLEFLLNKNRLNVAISRAQTLAIVVGNPALGQTTTGNIEQLKLLNLFSGLLNN